jgi:hypothetical protein
VNISQGKHLIPVKWSKNLTGQHFGVENEDIGADNTYFGDINAE